MRQGTGIREQYSSALEHSGKPEVLIRRWELNVGVLRNTDHWPPITDNSKPTTEN
jgi:hypothetical protein